jgi:hypothetical protein
LARLVDPRNKNDKSTEHGNFEDSATGAGVQQFGGDTKPNWLVIIGIIAVLFM